MEKAKKMGYFSTLMTIQYRSVSHQMLNKESVNVKYLESASDSCSHWDAIAAESNMHLDFTAIHNLKIHSVTCTHFSSPQCKSTPFKCGVKRRERHVSWLVGLGGRHDSQQGSDIPKPQEPRGATTSSTLAVLRPTLFCHSKLVDPTPLKNMVDFA